MKQKYPLLTTLFALAASAGLHAQIFYSNGATVAVTNGGILWCNGGITLDNTSTFTNDGSVTTTKNSSLTLPGTFTINASSAAQGSGTYQVEQDWINNATFVANSSTVRLYGNTQQFITSTNGTVTTFHNLTLLGNGTGNNRKKTLLLVNAISDASGNDSLNDRELETMTNTFFVQNTNTNAVQNNQTPGTEGFVSSDAPGVLSRLTSGSGAYLFPVGSSVATTRYRPILLTPGAAATNDEYTVRFINHDPNTDSYQRSINDNSFCTANNNFYHAILRPTGSDAADVAIYYIPASDGQWNSAAQWRTTNNQWNDIAATNQSTSGIFTLQTRNAWGFVNPGDPYVLTDMRPVTPTITCPTICENSNGTFAASGGQGYVWTVPANGTIVSGQGTDSLDVAWTTGVANVSVVSVSPTGCQSLPASCAPTVNPAPNAQFMDTVAGAWGSDYTFIDLTGGTGNSWTWDFGDGNNSTLQNPTHSYTGAGTYTVTLTVTSQGGCTDTAQMIVAALEGVLIPNVFTPNGDGTNDEFYIPNSGLKEYKIEIFDRWGVKVFESEAPEIHWDGRSTSGQPCTDGTYYFILHALTNTKDYSTTGFVTLIGSDKK